MISMLESTKMEKMLVTLMMFCLFWISLEVRGNPIDCDDFKHKKEKFMECHAKEFIKFVRKSKVEDVEKKLEKFSENVTDKDYLLHYADKLGIYKGFNALLWAAYHNDTSMMNLLIEKFENGTDYLRSAHSGHTALYYMASYGNKEILDKLLKLGASVNASIIGGYTPVFIAAENGYTAVVDALLESGADPNVNTTRTKGPSRASITPILVAAQNGNSDIVKLLLDKGADPNAKSDLRGFFPLYFAAKKGSVDMVKHLLNASADVTYQTAFGESALITAVAWNRESAVAELLDAAADPNVVDKLKTGALHRAAYYGYTNILKRLIEKGAYINVQNKKGRTPLHYCAKGANPTTLRELLNSCPDEKIRDLSGRTALDLAEAEEKRLMLKTRKTKRMLEKIEDFKTFIPMLREYTSKVCSKRV